MKRIIPDKANRIRLDGSDFAMFWEVSRRINLSLEFSIITRYAGTWSFIHVRKMIFLLINVYYSNPILWSSMSWPKYSPNQIFIVFNCLQSNASLIYSIDWFECGLGEGIVWPRARQFWLFFWFMNIQSWWQQQSEKRKDFSKNGGAVVDR